MIEAVLFDFDGTLTRPGAIDFRAIKQRLGCPETEALLEFIDRLDPSFGLEAMRILEEMELEAAHRAQPNEGALELLSAMKREDMPFGLLSRNRAAAIEVSLRAFPGMSLSDFAAVITREQAPPKPDPAGVLLASSRMGVTPGNLLLVGDYRFDIIAGQRAGTRTAFLTNGRASQPVPGDPVPDFRIERLRQIHTLLNLD